MPQVYSTYEAKARFSELLRKVRSGQTVFISFHGKEVAEIRPIKVRRSSLGDHLRQLEARGVLERGGRASKQLSPIARRPGALKRFLESRD